MYFTCICPHCQATLEALHHYQGLPVKCAGCQNDFTASKSTYHPTPHASLTKDVAGTPATATQRRQPPPNWTAAQKSLAVDAQWSFLFRS